MIGLIQNNIPNISWKMEMILKNENDKNIFKNALAYCNITLIHNLTVNDDRPSKKHDCSENKYRFETKQIMNSLKLVILLHLIGLVNSQQR